jgi:nucleoside-diphosphate-sugar epimerase
METNVLVTGAAGYIGTMLIERLSEIPSVGRINGIDIKERTYATRLMRQIELDSGECSRRCVGGIFE